MDKNKKLASAQDIAQALASAARDRYHKGRTNRAPVTSNGWQFPDEVKQIFTELTWKVGHHGKSRFGIEVGQPKSASLRHFQVEVNYKQAVPSSVVTVTEVTRAAGIPFEFLVVPQFRHENEWPEEYRYKYDDRDEDLAPRMLEYLTSSYSVTTEKLGPADEECEYEGCCGTGRISDTNSVTGEEIAEACPWCYPGGEEANLVEMPQPVRLVITSSKGVKEYDITPETLRFDRRHPNPGSVMGYITSVVYAKHKACLEEWVAKQQTKG